MYEIYFYQDRNGHEPVKEYLNDLSSKKDKNSRINLNKIRDFMKVLMIKGTRAGEPYIKHIDGELWELRPLRNRILFARWHNGRFILLHYFIKKTQKTPKREIETAKRRFEDMLERSEEK